MEYDKEFEGWFGSWWISGDFGSTRLAKDAAWYAWEAARKDHYRIGEEVDKPGVWDNAPEWATTAMAVWYGKDGQVGHSKDYTRELPKTRIDEIAEEAASHWEGGKEALEKAIKSVILQIRKEWEAER